MHNIVEVSIACKDQENMRKRNFIEYWASAEEKVNSLEVHPN